MRSSQYFPIAEATRLYVDENLPLRTVAKRIGWTHSTINAWLVRAGVKLRGRGGSTLSGLIRRRNKRSGSARRARSGRLSRVRSRLTRCQNRRCLRARPR